jgi:hypothetical protein
VASGATASPLDPPPVDLATRRLPVRRVATDKLARVSSHASGEPYFGRSGNNRFDDPAGGYGACYIGCGSERNALMVAFAESVLHDRTVTHGGFDIAVSELESRYVVRFDGTEKLQLANLTGAALKAIGLDGRISTITPYDIPQAWSAAIHAHPDRVDGIAYVSRHYNLGTAVVLFERGKSKVRARSCTPLPRVRYYSTLLKCFAVRPY